MNPDTIRGIYLEGARLLGGASDAFLEARILLLQAAGLDDLRFHADPDFPISGRVRRRYLGLVRRRRAGWPVAYLAGRKEFRSLSFGVAPGVLIPRPETEILLETALELAATGRESILDLGTGCGNIAVALALELPRARITAVDISARALRIAAANAASLGARRIRFLKSDLFSAFGRGRPRFDIIVSNPPYVGRREWSDLAPEVREHEPRRALLGGEEGPEFIGRLVRCSGKFLHPGGRLAVEIGAGQERAVRAMFGEGWDEVGVVPDLAGIPRVVVGRKAVLKPGRATSGSERGAGPRSKG